MSKKLLEKISDLIDKHIEEILDKKLEEIVNSLLVEKNSNDKNLSRNNENKFEDLFGNFCDVKNITKDHVMPKSNKGANSKSNILYLCKESNLKKDNKIEGEINGYKFKVVVDKNHNLKSGLVGAISVQKPNEKNLKSISTKKENKRFEDFKLAQNK